MDNQDVVESVCAELTLMQARSDEAARPAFENLITSIRRVASDATASAQLAALPPAGLLAGWLQGLR